MSTPGDDLSIGPADSANPAIDFGEVLRHSTRWNPSGTRRSHTALPFHFPTITAYPPIGEIGFVATTVDSRGRLANSSILRGLGWEPGDLFRADVDNDVAVVHRAKDGRPSVRANGCLYLPLTIRRRLRLSAGQRVLLAVAPILDMAAVFPSPVAATALWSYAPRVWTGLR